MVNPLFQPLFQQGYHISIGSCRYNDDKAINSPKNVALIQSLMDPSFSAGARTSSNGYQTDSSGSRGGSYDSGYQDSGSYDFYANTGAKGSANGTSVFNSFLDEAITGGSGSDMRTTSYFLGLTGRQMDSWGIANNVGPNERIELGNIIAGRGEYSDTGRTQGAYQLGGGSGRGMSIDQQIEVMQKELTSLRASNAKLSEANNNLQTRDNVESAIQDFKAKGLNEDQIAKELGYGNKAGLDKAVKDNPQEVADKLTENAGKLGSNANEILANNGVKASEESQQTDQAGRTPQEQGNDKIPEEAANPQAVSPGGTENQVDSPATTSTEGGNPTSTDSGAAGTPSTGGEGGSGPAA